MQEVENHLGETIDAVGEDARLDANAKELLSDVSILSEIIKRLIPEFKDVPTEMIHTYFSEEPSVSRVGVHPGQTNPSFEGAIRSLGQENKLLGEGSATFDVLFTLRLPGSGEAAVEVYVDLEAQGDEDLPYLIETRAVYYLGRLLSSQYQRDIKHSEYDKLKKVYSIWIIMDPKARNADTISSIAFHQEAILGEPEDNKGYDRCQAFLVRLSKNGSSQDRLVSLLDTLFESALSPGEKKTIITDQFNIPVSEHMERKLMDMCNYSSYVRKQGVREGMQLGEQQNELKNIKSIMETLNLSGQQAMDALKVPAEDRQKYSQLLAQ